MQYEIDICAL